MNVKNCHPFGVSVDYPKYLTSSCDSSLTGLKEINTKLGVS